MPLTYVCGLTSFLLAKPAFYLRHLLIKYFSIAVSYMLLATVVHRHGSLNKWGYRTCYLMLTYIAKSTIRPKSLLTQKGLQVSHTSRLLRTSAVETRYWRDLPFPPLKCRPRRVLSWPDGYMETQLAVFAQRALLPLGNFPWHQSMDAVVHFVPFG